MKTVALAVAVVNNQKLFSPRKYYKYQEPHFLYSSIEIRVWEVLSVLTI